MKAKETSLPTPNPCPRCGTKIDEWKETPDGKRLYVVCPRCGFCGKQYLTYREMVTAWNAIPLVPAPNSDPIDTLRLEKRIAQLEEEVNFANETLAALKVKYDALKAALIEVLKGE